ncbi:hypothetical protein N7539_007343 [Penicillium diatomitis]|uniref:Uncharacterized protein n=1 Tax=Penicillium diatomitis TaxID=2819901 RepID=A0A9X0BNR3_9EURO|nr:uncharacterized protein N7539_007343 [Penicillium diatomitis]KAJ5477199.1 hypothetical protein N7539_007343 [Penicillium diatomitis]
MIISAPDQFDIRIVDSSITAAAPRPQSLVSLTDPLYYAYLAGFFYLIACRGDEHDGRVEWNQGVALTEAPLGHCFGEMQDQQRLDSTSRSVEDRCSAQPQSADPI